MLGFYVPMESSTVRAMLIAFLFLERDFDITWPERGSESRDVVLAFCAFLSFIMLPKGLEQFPGPTALSQAEGSRHVEEPKTTMQGLC